MDSDPLPSLSLLAHSGAPDPGAGAGWSLDVMPAWTATDVPMLVTLPVLLALSGFFSGSETALFSISQAEKTECRRRHPLAGRAMDGLLSEPRRLLITILLGNMTVNVLYFVITSVLMMRSGTSGLGQTVMGVVFLLALVLLGEVGPKTAASAYQTRVIMLSAPVLITFHRAIGPLRVVIDRLVVAPLSRLTAPTTTPPELRDDELRSLLELSGKEGVLDDEELRLLRDVLTMRRLLVRDVMTPRTRMVALPVDATRAEVVAATRDERLTRIPVYEGNLDHVVGVLHTKPYLLDPDATAVTHPAVLAKPHYVPEVATLEQMLDEFRRRHARSAIVVDEYGGTEGVVAVEDVVEELVGELVGPGETDVTAPRLVGLGRWLVRGDMSLHDFEEAFDPALPETKLSTVGGLIVDALGRAPALGDRVAAGRARLEVVAVEGSRVVEATVSLEDDEAAEGGS
jgi:putative hemolysin